MTDRQIKERPCIQPTEINVSLTTNYYTEDRGSQFFQNYDTSKRSLPLCTASLIHQVCNCSDKIQLLHTLCW